ncbi:MAG TPA: GNAT family N-acetyltransferase [Burkholderiales bacterium]|nr:GNAT family N-acetyltransferase [Burkholderiales bacterium]
MAEAPAVARSTLRYPAESVEVRMLADGRPLLIRPMGAKDAELFQDFVRRLSVSSRYQRFQGGVRELPPELLRRLLAVDYGRSMAFAAVLFEHGRRRMIGEARYAPALDGSGAADFALAVADGWQRQGIGRLLFEHLLKYAEQHGVSRMQGDVLHANTAMLGLAREFGFSPRLHPDGAWLTRVERRLGSLSLAA